MIFPIAVLMFGGLFMYSAMKNMTLTDALRSLLGRAPTGSLGSLHTFTDNSSSTATGTSTGGTSTITGTPNSRGVINPIKGWRHGRDDAGVDASAPPGTPYLAPMDMHLVGTASGWYPTSYIYKADQPLPGAPTDLIYVAEGITSPGKSSFKRGEVVARSTGSSIETGWGSLSSNSRTYAEEQGRGWEMTNPGVTTVDGESFRKYFGIS